MPKRKSKRKQLKDFVLVKGSSVGMSTLLKMAENTTVFKHRAIGPSDIMSRHLTQMMSQSRHGRMKAPINVVDIQALTPERADELLKEFHSSTFGRLVSHDKKGQDVVAFDIEAYPQEGDGYIVTAHKSKGSAWGIIPMDFSAAELRVAALGTAEGWGLRPATTGRRVEFKPELQELPREDPPGYWSPSNLDKLLKDGKC